MAQRWTYQPLAQPLPADDAGPVTADRWAQAPQAPRRAPARANPGQLAAPAEPTLFAAPPELSWRAPAPERPRPRPRPAAPGGATPIVDTPADPPPLPHWPEPPASRPRPARRRPGGGAAPAWEPSLLQEPPFAAWWRPAAEPVRQKPHLARHPGEAFVGEPGDLPVPDVIVPPMWWRPAAEPVRQPPHRLRRPGSAYEAEPSLLPANEEITPDKWFAREAEPVRRPRHGLRLPAVDAWGLDPALIPVDPPMVSVEKWWRAPVRREPPREMARLGGWAGVLEPSLLLTPEPSWWAALTLPRPRSPRQLPPEPAAFDPGGVPGPALTGVPLAPPALPFWRPARRRDGLSVALPAPPGSFDLPLLDLPQVLRRRPSAQPPSPGLAADAPEPVPLGRWWREPAGVVLPRRPGSAGLSASPVEPSAVPEEVIPLSWWREAAARPSARPLPARPPGQAPLLDLHTEPGWASPPLPPAALPRRRAPAPQPGPFDPAAVALPPALPWLGQEAPRLPPAPRPAGGRPGASPPEWLGAAVEAAMWFASPGVPFRPPPRLPAGLGWGLWLPLYPVVRPGRRHLLRWSQGYPVLLLWGESMAVESVVDVYKGEDAVLHFEPEGGPVDISAWTLAAALARRGGLSRDVTPLLTPAPAVVDAKAGTFTLSFTSQQLQEGANAGKFEVDVWRDDDGLRAVLARVLLRVHKVARW